MAKHRRKRNSGYWPGRVSNGLGLATTADQALVKSNLATAVIDRAFAISYEGTVGLHGLTPGEGPIIVGMAHSDYTAAEIEEWLENQANWDRTDKIAQERGRRKCRIFGTFDGETATEVLRDGMKIKVKLGFIVEDGSSLALWAYNDSGAVFTTGGVVEWNGLVHFRST